MNITILEKYLKVTLIHYSLVLLFYTPRKQRKPKGFLIFLRGGGGIEKQHRIVMGKIW